MNPTTPPADTGIGAALPRVEDARLLTGQGQFVDDLQPEGVLRAYFLRSPHAHAEILAIDTTEAARMPGVQAVLTAQDYIAAGYRPIPCTVMPPAVKPGTWFASPFYPLAHERVRHVGEAVVMVLAHTLDQAMDAAEMVQVDYAAHPAITAVRDALAPEAPLIWPQWGSNTNFEYTLGDEAATRQALEGCAHQLHVDLVNPRLAGVPMEPRGCVARMETGGARLAMTTSTQNPHRIRQMLADLFDMPSHRLRVTAGDVGGGFGTKGGLYPEEVLVAWATLRTGAPVKWTSTRSESFLADFHGRDQWAQAWVGFDDAGRVQALRLESNHNIGSYAGPSAGITAMQCSRMFSGVYAIAAMHAVVRGVMTHTRPLTPYRGAGRPEAAYLIENIMDAVARHRGLDPVTVRRRNFIRPEQMPYRTAIGEVYDCGEFETLMDKTLAAADWQGFEARRQASARAGRLRGRGLSVYIEVSGSANERMEIRFDPSGWPTIVAGTLSHGQGHETVYRQMVHDWLGVPLACIGFLQGDTDTVSYGRGTNASRSMAIGGSALKRACDEVLVKARSIAGHVLQRPAEELGFAGGEFRHPDGATISLRQVAKGSYAPGGHPLKFGLGLEGTGVFSSVPANYPNGCHVVELEIDPRTGRVTIDRYCAGDDVGVAINPLLLEGQIHGGLAQGIGQALLEEVVFDASGQLVNGSFIDYAMPKAEHMPPLQLVMHNVPTASNLLGAKGAGEVGAVGAPPAIMQAIAHALADTGAQVTTLPATALKIWQALQRAKSPTSLTTSDAQSCN